jgi:hypothetical protein
VNGLWLLPQENSSENFNKFIVMSFISETRIMGSIDSQIEDVSFQTCFETNSSTIDCALMKNGVYVQITEEKVILFKCGEPNQYEGKILNTWKPKNGKISLSSISDSSILLCYNKNFIIKLFLEE